MITLLAMFTFTSHAVAQAQDYTLRTAPPLPERPSYARTQLERLAKDAGLIVLLNERGKEVYGSTPKWERFLRVGQQMIEARSAARSNPRLQTNLMALAISGLGPPDWVTLRCGEFRENQCDA